MDELLQPDEKVIHRAKPAWRAILLMTGGGIGIAAVMHVIPGIWGGDWRCPAGLLTLFFAGFLVGAKSIAASATAALVTDCRVLYRHGVSVETVILDRADIVQVEMLEDEVPIAGVRLRDRQGETVDVRLLASPRRFREALLGNPGAATAPHTPRGALLFVVAFTVAAFAAFNLFLLVMIYGFAWPLSELFGLLRETLGGAEDLRYILVSKALVVAFTVLLVGPLLATAAIGAILGFLPFLALSRCVISFEEARELALILRRRFLNIGEEEANGATSYLIEFTFNIWMRPLGRPFTRLAESLVSWLYRRPIDLPQPSV